MKLARSLVIILLFVAWLFIPGMISSQTSQQPVPSQPEVLRSEKVLRTNTRLVVVDVVLVATDPT